MSRQDTEREIVSFAPGGISFGSGMLGATGSTPEMAQAERLNEIERRILAIEETLRTLQGGKK